MDETDLRIFTRLVGNSFLTDTALGREVGLTGKAVRLRRRRMESEGVVTEYGIHPAAEFLGRHAVEWRYAGTAGAPLPIARLAEVEDLAYVMSFRPALHRVVRFTTEPDPAPDRRLTRMLGPPLGGPDGERMAAVPARGDDLSRVDWKVLEAVVAAPRAPYSVLARRANLALRTVRLHRSKLEAIGALRSAMILDLEREAGVATYGVWLKVDATFDPRAVELPRLWDRPHWTESPRGVYLLGSAENYIAAREVELRLRALPGVVGADPLLPAGGYFARERLLSWIRGEAARYRASGPRRGPRSDRAAGVGS